MRWRWRRGVRSRTLWSGEEQNVGHRAPTGCPFPDQRLWAVSQSRRSGKTSRPEVISLESWGELFGKYLRNVGQCVFARGASEDMCRAHRWWCLQGERGEVNTLKKLEYLNICFLIVIWWRCQGQLQYLRMGWQRISYIKQQWSLLRTSVFNSVNQFPS